MSTTSSCKLMEGIVHRFAVIGIPTDLHRPLARSICRWVECSGVEWTVKRLKSLKVDLIRRLNNQELLTRTRKGMDGNPHGYFGRLYRIALQNEIAFGKCIQALQVYSMFTSESLTPSQRDKFLQGVQAPTVKLDPTFVIDFRKSIAKHFHKRSVCRQSDVSLIAYRGSPSKRKPSLYYITNSTNLDTPKKGQDQDVLSNAAYFCHPAHKSLYFKYRCLYDPVLSGMESFKKSVLISAEGLMSFDHEFVEGGEIHFLQEPGMKLRSIASPHLVHQLALRHLGESVHELIQSFPWDCTHDQLKPRAVLQSHLSKGKTVYSVDLSSATDQFPLELQVMVLKCMFGDIPDIHLFRDISRSYWRSPLGVIQWTKGQPLGLRPSFGTFAMTHGLLLWFLCGNRHEDKFFVLGDDVVILDKDLYIKYTQKLEEMNCPYSRDKSITSAKLCEFAGKIFTGTRVITQLKWKEVSNDNFLDICRQLGIRSRSLLSKRQRIIFDMVKYCTLPFGLNFNPKGISLMERDEITKDLFQRNDTEIGSLMGLSSVIRQNVYGETTLRSDLREPSVRVILDKIETYDKYVREVLYDLLPSKPWLSQWLVSNYLWGISGVPGSISKFREEPRRLPIRYVEPSRLTLLEKLERMLVAPKGG